MKLNEYFVRLAFQSPYAQLLAATTLTKLVSRPNVTLPLEQRIDIRKKLFQYCVLGPLKKGEMCVCVGGGGADLGVGRKIKKKNIYNHKRVFKCYIINFIPEI